jgi:hypothetical protein
VVDLCASTALMAASIGSVVRPGLGDVHYVMDSCREEALYGTMVASTTCLAKLMRIYVMKMD